MAKKFKINEKNANIITKLLNISINGKTTISGANSEKLSQNLKEKFLPLTNREKYLINNILSIGDLTVENIMLPRSHIVGIPSNSKFIDVIRIISGSVHSNYPVYADSMDNIVGVISIKDVFCALASKRKPTLKSLLNDSLVVSPSIRILDLLLEMHLKQRTLALVVDEFGGVDGLITINNLIAEIVGDSKDNAIIGSLAIQRKENGNLIVDGSLEIENFVSEFGEFLTKDELADKILTISGLIVNIVGRVPDNGEIVKHSSGIEFIIIDRSPKRVLKAEVRGLKDS